MLYDKKHKNQETFPTFPAFPIDRSPAAGNKGEQGEAGRQSHRVDQGHTRRQETPMALVGLWCPVPKTAHSLF